ncbi:MAG: Fis family transcriptional regulator [Acidobacteria bacterium]|nr:MAG: Fis family transcriptional regulator [Acidobacteriota bacterium]
MFRAAGSRDVTTRPEEIGDAFSGWLADEPHKWPSRVPNPIGSGDVCVVPLRLGLQDEIGVIVAGSQRPDFPDETERLLLRVAANQAAIGLQEARLLSEQKRVARELDQRVAQRTRELATANEELRRTIDAIAQAIVVLGPDGRTLDANAFFLDYTGLSLEEVKADDSRVRRFHPDDVTRVQEERRQALLRGEPFELEQRSRRKDGQYRWFLIRYNPVRDNDGNIIRWYATGTDIDDRKRVEERVQSENLALREEVDRSSMFEEIVGSSEPLRRVLAQVAKVAPTDSTVLILGETGTGKELIARAIHKRSNRSTRAFIRVNCAAIPPSLIASELFGHEKGAFTGALQRRVGRFEAADGGTIFLDEIGELPLETQSALLRVLQERELERVGSSQSIAVDVRVLAASNRNLKLAVAAGTFRQDLFYRLNVFPIQIPALRERAADISLLVEYLIDRYARRAAKKIRTIEGKTMKLLKAYDWPGNIRELQNVIERAVILCETDTFTVDEAWLKRELSPASTREDVQGESLRRLDRDREKEMIEAALAGSRGRISGPFGAAARLGIPRQTLESRIASLGINRYRFKSL